MRNTCEIATAALEGFIAAARERDLPVLQQTPMAELSDQLDLTRLITKGGLHGDTLRQFLETYLASATRLHHPGNMAHQVAIPAPGTAAAALVDAVTNNVMAIYEMGPSAATVEFAVINWMLAKVGWTPAPLPGASSETACAGGTLTSGGSLANLTALSAARQRAAPDAWQQGNPDNLILVAPAGCHYSIKRAAGILGLGCNAVKDAPTDAEGRIIPDQLKDFILEQRQAGNVIMAVVANACATAAGLYDALRPVATICRELDVWLHIDGAHGASALVSATHRHLLDGVDLADSLIWDAHKMLQTPALCAAVLVRDHRDLDRAFQQDASYLFHDKDQPGFDFIHRTVECTKAGLGLKLFFALATEGEQAIAAFIDRQMALCVQAAGFIGAQPDFEVAAAPQSNILCFRMTGDDALQLTLRKKLTERGNCYISSTEFRGRRWLRISLMNPATAMIDIQTLIAEIRVCAHKNASSLAVA